MATSLAQATELMLTQVSPLGTEVVSLDDAHGRCVAEDVSAAHSIPPFENSAMDGFAVRAADTAAATAESPARLNLVFESRAGTPADGELLSGQAARISTGAAMPIGADSVIRVEDASVDGNVLRVSAPVDRGCDVRLAGDDVTAGTVIVAGGSQLRAGELAALATCGRRSVTVTRRPRVALVGTGDELVALGEPLGPGQIHDSNTPMLAALTGESGGEVTSVHARVGDSLERTVAAIADAAKGADIVLISGGVSAGQHDHVRPALAALGARELFWQLALRPGHPTWFGTIDETVVFGLPGNPASAYAVFQLLVRPALARLEGRGWEPLEFQATYRGETRSKPRGIVTALRCTLSGPDGSPAVVATGNSQQSHSLTSLVGVNALALIGEDRDRIEDGDATCVRLI